MDFKIILTAYICFQFCTTLNAAEGTGFYLRLAGTEKLFVQARYDVPAYTATQPDRVLHTRPGAYPGAAGMKFFLDGPFLQGEDWNGKKMCWDCVNGEANCQINMLSCDFYINYSGAERMYVKVHPNQAKGPNGQLLFSIYSESQGTHCVTHSGYATLNRFHMKECANPPTQQQSFFIDPGYLDLVQELQGLRDLRISNMVYSTLMGMCPVAKH